MKLNLFGRKVSHSEELVKRADELRRHHKAAVTDLKNDIKGNGKKKRLNVKRLKITLQQVKLLRQGEV